MSNNKPAPRVMFCGYDGAVQGGPNVWMQRLFPDLLMAGIDLHPIILHWDDEGDCQTLHLLRKSGMPVRSLHLGEGITLEMRIRWLIAQAREIGPDVFVAHHVVPAYFAAVYLRRVGVKTVGVIHSDESFYEAIFDRFCLDRQFRAVDCLVVVSKALESAARLKPVQDLSVARIPCGCPLPETCRPESAEGHLRVLYLGRLAQKQKRIIETTEAFLKAAEKFSNMTFSIIGDGPDADEVKRLVENHQNSRVRFVAAIVPERVIPTMLEHDIFVLLSDYEGLPIALLEAMACGMVPVCLRTRSGVTELIENRINGVLVDDRKADFFEALRQLDLDPDKRKQLAAAARKTVLGGYTCEATHGQWANLLRDLAISAKPHKIRQPMCVRLPPIDARFRWEDTPRRGFDSSLNINAIHLLSRAKQKFNRLKRLITGQ